MSVISSWDEYEQNQKRLHDSCQAMALTVVESRREKVPHCCRDS